MSKRRIKPEVKKIKKPKVQEISPKNMMIQTLNMKRAIAREDDNAEVVALITTGDLDILKIDDYKYMRSIAEKMNWKQNRLLKTANKVAELLKEEEKMKEKENE